MILQSADQLSFSFFRKPVIVKTSNDQFTSDAGLLPTILPRNPRRPKFPSKRSIRRRGVAISISDAIATRWAKGNPARGERG